MDGMRRLFAEGEEVNTSAFSVDEIKDLLAQLRDDWADKGVEIVNISTGWRFQSRPEMRRYLERMNPEKPPKYFACYPGDAGNYCLSPAGDARRH